VRHRFNRRIDGIGVDIESDGDDERIFGLQKFGVVDDVAETNGFADFVGNFDADGGFSGNRRFDPNRMGGQIHLEIIGDGGDFLGGNATAQREFVPGNGRTFGEVCDFAGDIER